MHMSVNEARHERPTREIDSLRPWKSLEKIVCADGRDPVISYDEGRVDRKVFVDRQHLAVVEDQLGR